MHPERRRSWRAGVAVALAVSWPMPVAASDGEPPSTEPPTLINSPILELPGDTAPTTVIVEITVGVDGTASDPSLIEPTGSVADALALNAVPSLRFRPATVDGAPVAARVQFAFELKPTPQPASETAGPVPPVEQAEEPNDNVAPELVFGDTATVEATPTAPSKHVLSGEVLRELPGTRGDPLRAIETMPGVGRTTLGDGAPRIRGAASFESVSFIAGLPVPQLYHFGGLTSVIHPDLIEEVTLYPGNFPARYGRATAGVVSATIRDPKDDRFHGQVELGTLDASALVEAPLGSHASALVAARHSTINFFFDAFVPEDAYSTVTAPTYYDYQALFALRLGVSKLRLFGFGSSDKIELAFDEPNDENPDLRGDVGATVRFNRIQASLETPLGEGSVQNIAAGYGYGELGINIADTDTARDLHEFYQRSSWDIAANEALRFRFGLDMQASIVAGRYGGQRPPQNEGDPDGSGSVSPNNRVDIQDVVVRWAEPAAYLEMDWYATESLLILPSLRADYYTQIGTATVDPRLAVRYSVSDNMVLKAAAGKYSRPPLYYETMEELGNPDLDPTYAWQVSGGAEYELFGDAVELGIEGFYKHLVDRVVATDGGVAPYFINDGAGRIVGAESSLRAYAGGFSSFFAYTLSRSERADRDEPYRVFDEDQTHNLSATASYEFGDSGWKAGARFRLISGNPFTPIRGAAFNGGTGQYQPLFGANNSDRRPLFHQLDLRVEKAWKWKPLQLTALVEVLNAYNAENVEATTYSYDFREREDALGLPLFPSLGIRGEW